jgi:cysteine desulfurase
MVSPTDVEAAIRPDTALISIMHANNETGSIQPIGKIGNIARKHNIGFHIDSSQSAGKIAIDVNRTGVDLLTLAGHKIYAPKGIGALFVREGVKIENILYGAGQEGGLRPGTENVVHIAAMGKACELALHDFDKNTDNMRHMRDLLLQGLNKLYPGKTTLHTDLQQCLPNTLSVAIKGVDAHALITQLANKVMFSTGSACHAGQVYISPVLNAMGVDAQTAASTLRFSTGKHTTKIEIDRALHLIQNTVE